MINHAAVEAVVEGLNRTVQPGWHPGGMLWLALLGTLTDVELDAAFGLWRHDLRRMYREQLGTVAEQSPDVVAASIDELLDRSRDEWLRLAGRLNGVK